MINPFVRQQDKEYLRETLQKCLVINIYALSGKSVTAVSQSIEFWVVWAGKDLACLLNYNKRIVKYLKRAFKNSRLHTRFAIRGKFR